ncbi:MAG TPA: methyltransferase domain-containing protein [Gemmatimonadaceae bacterium]|nr:methyltransferase domain-containing protein [Gemmatimonadaceae bacterium]
MARQSWQDRYEARFYTSRPGWIDGTTEFHHLIRAKFHPGERILEIGSGPPNPTTDFLATLGEVHGIDPDPAILNNSALTSAAVLTGNTFPYSDNEFGLCVSNYVVEHVRDGPAHLAGVARVLAPGGRYVFRTVNRYHYLGLVSAITPHWFHTLVANRARRLPAGSHDPYETTYALNTKAAIKRAAASAGLSCENVTYVEKEPTYGRFSRLAYLAMTGYERVVNAVPKFAPLRVNLFVVLRKPRDRATLSDHV